MPNPILKQAVIGQRIDLLGPSVESLTSPYDPQKDCCVLRGTTPPSCAASLRHHDIEDFYVIFGRGVGFETRRAWLESIACKTGDYIHVPSGAPHSEPFVTPIITTPPLGKFFLEAGRPLEQASQFPTSEEKVSTKYRYWNAAPEENASAGISFDRATPSEPRAPPQRPEKCERR